MPIIQNRPDNDEVVGPVLLSNGSSTASVAVTPVPVNGRLIAAYAATNKALVGADSSLTFKYLSPGSTAAAVTVTNGNVVITQSTSVAGSVGSQTSVALDVQEGGSLVVTSGATSSGAADLSVYFVIRK